MAAADFSHIQTSKARSGGDAASLTNKAIESYTLPLLEHWSDAQDSVWEGCLQGPEHCEV